MSTIIAIAAFLALGIARAQAHGVEGQLSRATWTIDPWIIAPLALAAILYGAGLLRLRRRIGEVQGRLFWQAVAYSGALLTLVAALVSPLHSWGETLFTFHMIEHEIIMAISAPLIVVARPIGVLMWGLPQFLRRRTAAALKTSAVQRAWSVASHGVAATALHGVVIWGWHVPALFDAAVADESLHRLQHLSFLVTAVLFWWSVLWCSDRGVAAWHIFVTMLHTSVLGALMTLAPRVLYVLQTQTAFAWRLTPLEDQQLAGLVMWIPAGTIYAGAALALLAMWIRSSGRESVHVIRQDVL